MCDDGYTPAHAFTFSTAGQAIAVWIPTKIQEKYKTKVTIIERARVAPVKITSFTSHTSLARTGIGRDVKM